MKFLDLNGLSYFWSKITTYVNNLVSNFYTKPSTGIPKTDLASDVLTSLGKADTAMLPSDQVVNYQVIQRTSLDTYVTISPQTANIWGEMSSLTIALAPPSNNEIINEYIFQFNSGSTATSLSLPSDVKFTSTVTIEANMHYECNIVYNSNDDAYYGIIVGWAID